MASITTGMRKSRPNASRRVEILRNAPKNAWVALSKDENEIVATGETFIEADQNAKKSGAQDYILTRTPDEWMSRALVPLR
jgi:hypothetical protein